jgi:hypothetical protein
VACPLYETLIGSPLTCGTMTGSLSSDTPAARPRGHREQAPQVGLSVRPSPDWLKEETCGARREAGGGGALGMSYWSTTSTFTLTSDTPAILTIVPETWMVNSS